jgi:hypothetical protein
MNDSSATGWALELADGGSAALVKMGRLVITAKQQTATKRESDIEKKVLFINSERISTPLGMRLDNSSAGEAFRPKGFGR